MRILILTLLLPTLIFAQEFTFRQEYDTIPVEIDGWQPFVPWIGGLSISTPCLVDIDSDDDLDFFTGNSSGFITHLENQGGMTNPIYVFITQEFANVDLSDITYAGKTSPEFCDLDADMDLDLFTGDGRGLIHYWENIGTSLQPEFVHVTDSLSYIDVVGFSRFVFRDLDHDSDFDIIIGDYYGDLWYYENIGNPQNYLFTSPQQFESINVGGFADPTLIDIDADNDLDLFIGCSDGNIWYYENIGTPTAYNFEFRTEYYNSIDVGASASPEFADIDGDGDYDLFVGRDDIDNAVYSPGDIYFYENIGTPDSAQWQFITRNYLSLDEGERAYNNSVDIDADFDTDIFLGNRGNSISYYKNVGDSCNPSLSWITSSYQGINVNGCKPYFIDLDNDQDADLIIGEGVIPNPPYPGLHLYRNNGTPQNALFNLVSDDLIPWNYNASIYPALADIDADGDNDIFMNDNDGTFYFSENIGTSQFPTFASPVEHWQGITPQDGSFFRFYDLDGDQDFDLFFAQGYFGDTYVTFYRNIGSPQSPQFDSVPDTLLHVQSGGLFFRGIDILDIDSDGDGDFFLGMNQTGGILFFRNTTGDTSAVGPRTRFHNYAVMDFSIGPNPANPITWISYNLPYPQKAEIAVYNLLGQKVATLASGLQMPGERSVVWNTSQSPSGVYFIRFDSSIYDWAGRIVVVK